MIVLGTVMLLAIMILMIYFFAVRRKPTLLNVNPLVAECFKDRLGDYAEKCITVSDYVYRDCLSVRCRAVTFSYDKETM